MLKLSAGSFSSENNVGFLIKGLPKNMPIKNGSHINIFLFLIIIFIYLNYLTKINF